MALRLQLDLQRGFRLLSLRQQWSVPPAALEMLRSAMAGPARECRLRIGGDGDSVTVEALATWNASDAAAASSALAAPRTSWLGWVLGRPEFG